MTARSHPPMTLSRLLQQSLRYYWRTNVPVVLGVAIAIAVLTGALVVGDSVRASLLKIFLARLGNTSHVLQAGRFFREELAAELQAHEALRAHNRTTCPILFLEGLVVDQQSGRRAGSVQVYGIDVRFWEFHGAGPPQAEAPPRTIWLSPALAGELATANEETLLLRVEKPSAIPAESLHGRKEDTGLTLRCTMAGILPVLGEFSFRPGQSEVRAVFLPLQRLQRELGLERRVNAILISGPAAPSLPAGTQEEQLVSVIRATCRPADLGLLLRRPLDAGFLIVEHEAMVLGTDAAAAALRAADQTGLSATPVLTYLANSLRAGSKAVPYSLVTAMDFGALKQSSMARPAKQAATDHPPILLNAWAARELQARAGDRITLEYYAWLEEGRLVTRTADFSMEGALPVTGGGLDPDLAPNYPGITGARDIRSWDPPFPMELSRIRPEDEAYWSKYRTIPKAVVDAETGRRLWGSRHGEWTSLRLSATDPGKLSNLSSAFESALHRELDPLRHGFALLPVRDRGIAASAGATDFGEYFLYFSLFLMVSALMLIALFFKLGIEQRAREIGLLKALGLGERKTAALLLAEGTVLALLGTLAGLIGAAAYGGLVLLGLNTWWIDAVGTSRLEMSLQSRSIGVGIAGGLAAAVLSMVWALRGLVVLPPLALLTGTWSHSSAGSHHERDRITSTVRVVFLSVGLLLLLLAWRGRIPETGGFFAAGAALLIAVLADQALRLRRSRARPVRPGWAGLGLLGLRNASIRPGRSLLCTALIACATFLMIAVSAFRRVETANDSGRHSGTGGFSLLAESMLPVIHDPGSAEGRAALNLPSEPFDQVRWARFRMRPGDDSSCLNLYRPGTPRLLAPDPGFVREGRFRFRESLAATPEEQNNPWLLLEKDPGDGAIPAIADANSLAYVLHLGVGAEWALPSEAGPPLRFRIVASLSDSLFQSELLISEGNFKRLFPAVQGRRFFLIEAGTGGEDAVTRVLEERLADSGLDVMRASERLASYHRVENTYLSTFQALGALGLLLGTCGLGAVLLRNVFERRRELALQQAVGFGPAHLAWVLLAENARLLVGGVLSGGFGALLAIVPTVITRDLSFPWPFLLVTLLAIFGTGVIATLVAIALALRTPLLQALRSE